MNNPNTNLEVLLHSYFTVAMSEREKGTYFEELMLQYFRNEPYYKNLYSKVWAFADWAKETGADARDVGIDLVAETTTNELHAIQCKFYAADYKIRKADIDSFFTASGKKIFKHRIIVSTTNLWSEHAEEAMTDQIIPVTKISLYDLEASRINWNEYISKKKIGEWVGVICYS